MFGLTPLTPAYGRDYRSRDALIADLNKGLDFVTASGQYISLSQLQDLPIKEVAVRYSNARKVTLVKIGKGGAS